MIFQNTSYNSSVIDARIAIAKQFVISEVSRNGFARLAKAPKGNRYKINFINPNGYTLPTYFNLKFSYNNIKFVVGQRKCYARLQDAIAMADLWFALLRNAEHHSDWARWISMITIVDATIDKVIYSLK